jgi:hypothetical protein
MGEFQLQGVTRGKGRIWSDEEDEVLLGTVKENRETIGLGKSLEITSTILGRTYLMCKNRWYGVLAKSKETTTGQPAESPKNSLDTFLEDTKELHYSEEEPSQREMVQEKEQFFESDNVQNTEVMRPPYIKINIHPITQAQLDSMTESELFDLLLNVTIKIQMLSNESHKDNRQLHRDLMNESREKEEYKVGYTSLLGVINTARQMAVEDIGSEPARFRMDKNGNLESIK